MECYLTCTYDLIREIDKYNSNWNVEEKIKFLLRYEDISKTNWGQALVDLCFIFDFRKKTLNRIQKTTYDPLFQFDMRIKKYKNLLVWALQEKKYTHVQILNAVKDIESLLFEREKQTDDKKTNNALPRKIVLSRKVFDEITTGYYYKLMYHKKKSLNKTRIDNKNVTEEA